MPSQASGQEKMLRYMNDDRAAIEQDVENYINEADQDFPWLNDNGKDNK